MVSRRYDNAVILHLCASRRCRSGGWRHRVTVPHGGRALNADPPGPGASMTTVQPGGEQPADTLGPTVLRMLLGKQLHRFREAAGVTHDRAGYEIRASRSKISRMENGRVGFKERDVADLLTLYGITDEQVRAGMLSLAGRLTPRAGGRSTATCWPTGSRRTWAWRRLPRSSAPSSCSSCTACSRPRPTPAPSPCSAIRPHPPRRSTGG